MCNFAYDDSGIEIYLGLYMWMYYFQGFKALGLGFKLFVFNGNLALLLQYYTWQFLYSKWFQYDPWNI